MSGNFPLVFAPFVGKFCEAWFLGERLASVVGQGEKARENFVTFLE
jgi:hypothetical protein